MVVEPSEKLAIAWSPVAQKQWKSILEFFVERNQSNVYSLKLDDKMMFSLELLSGQPEMGQQTDWDGIRCHIVENYTVFYRVKNKTLEVLSIRDARREPED